MHSYPGFGPGRTFVSKILWRERSEGSYARAHLPLYIKTMTDLGFAEDILVGVPPLPATRRLVDGYLASTDEYHDALGWLYGTQVIDLTIVVGFGRAIKRVTGTSELPWV